MPNKNLYVLGYAMNQNRNKVLMLEDSDGTFNGVFGKPLQDELPILAMSRIFMEQTGVYTRSKYWEWEPFLTLQEKENGKLITQITCFRYYTNDIALAQTNHLTEGKIGVFNPEFILQVAQIKYWNKVALPMAMNPDNYIMALIDCKLHLNQSDVAYK